MSNKYNLDFYKTMEVANNYLDKIEDNIDDLRVDDDMLLNLEDKLFMYLEKGEYRKLTEEEVQALQK